MAKRIAQAVAAPVTPVTPLAVSPSMVSLAQAIGVSPRPVAAVKAARAVKTAVVKVIAYLGTVVPRTEEGEFTTPIHRYYVVYAPGTSTWTDKQGFHDMAVGNPYIVGFLMPLAIRPLTHPEAGFIGLADVPVYRRSGGLYGRISKGEAFISAALTHNIEDLTPRQ